VLAKAIDDIHGRLGILSCIVNGKLGWQLVFPVLAIKHDGISSSQLKVGDRFSDHYERITAHNVDFKYGSIVVQVFLNIEGECEFRVIRSSPNESHFVGGEGTGGLQGLDNLQSAVNFTSRQA